MNRIVVIISVLLCISLHSCNDMDDVEIENGSKPKAEIKKILVLSEGLFNSNNSTLAAYSFADTCLQTDVFTTVNGRGLGDTANDMVKYGSKIFVVVNVSSQIEVIDTAGVSIKQIPMFDSQGNSRQPRYISFAEGKVYVCNFDGTVARIDTTSLQIDAVCQVGKNPDGICVASNKLYVSNSGGLDYPNYGNTVSVIYLKTFTHLTDIVVGTNPYRLTADSQNDVYVITRGDYGSEPYALHRIDTSTDKVVETFSNIESLNMRICNDTAYIYNYDYGTQQSWIKRFDCINEKLIDGDVITDGTQIQTPYGIDVDEATGDIFITDAKNFTVTGDLLCFNRNGVLKYRIDNIGLNPNKTLIIK